MTTKNWQEEITAELLSFANESQAAKLVAVRDCGAIKDAAAILGISERIINRTLKVVRDKAARQGYAPANDMRVTVPDGYHLRGTSTLYKDGQQALQWVKTSIDHERQAEMMREMIEAMAEDLPRLPASSFHGTVHADLLAVYPIGDAHIGMLAWGEESGDDWDLKIAEETMCGAFRRCVDAAPHCEQALIVNLGDWYHTETMDGVTARSGHHLDTDGRYAKMVRVGVKIIRSMIDAALMRHASVRVVNVQGNHDQTAALMLSVCLSNIYENEPRVSIDSSPSFFNYFEFGCVLIGSHHGHTCKADKLGGVMAADMPEAWGRTKHRYWLTGHIHHDSMKEYPGCSVESFCTLAAKDAYASAGGWRSRRNTKCIVMHREHGEIERHTIDISQLAIK